MHDAAWKYISNALVDLEPLAVLELGSRDINGSPRGMLPHEQEYWGVDIAPGFGVDIIGDARIWRPGADLPAFDVCICAEVAEHCPNWQALLETAHDCLIPGGVFIFTAAGPGRAPHSAVDGGAIRHEEYYQNVSPEALSYALEVAGFDEFTIDLLGEDIRATARRGV